MHKDACRSSFSACPQTLIEWQALKHDAKCRRIIGGHEILKQAIALKEEKKRGNVPYRAGSRRL